MNYRKKMSIRVRSGNAPVWNAVSDIIGASRKDLAKVNLSKISKYATDGGVVVIPGKVLATGELTKKVTILGLFASKVSQKKIAKNGSSFIPFEKATFEHKNVLLLR